MNMVTRKLSGGGDKIVEQMFEDAAMLGIDIIELRWLSKHGNPRFSVAQIVGIKIPIISKMNINDDTISADSWTDGIVYFYPDDRGICWGYVYDIPENRRMIYSCLSNGWFRVSNQEIRAEINKEAEENGFRTDIIPLQEVNVRKSPVERATEDKIKNMERSLKLKEDMMEQMRKELLLLKNEKQVIVDKKIENTPKQVTPDRLGINIDTSIKTK